LRVIKLTKKTSSVYIEEKEWNLFKYNSKRLHGKSHNQRIADFVVSENRKDAGDTEVNIQINIDMLENERDKLKKIETDKLKVLDRRVASDGTTVLDVLRRLFEAEPNSNESLQKALEKIKTYDCKEKDHFNDGDIIDFSKLIKTTIKRKDIERQIREFDRKNVRQKNIED
jgi:hypothetical protein